jgi:hypothetical protein
VCTFLHCFRNQIPFFRFLDLAVIVILLCEKITCTKRFQCYFLLLLNHIVTITFIIKILITQMISMLARAFSTIFLLFFYSS